MTATRRTLLTAAALSLPALHNARAQAPIRFSLDWALQGNHGMWALAEDRGIYRQLGLSVRMDRGFGSGDTIVKVASGAYDIGFADISSGVKFNAENPDKRIVSIYQVYDRTAAALVTMKGRGIDKPQDIAGKSLGAPEGEGSRMLFPAFAKVANIDTSAIRWTSMAANLRDTMLAQRRVEAVTGFLSTVHFNLVAAGIPEGDVVSFPYAEHGLDIFGSAVFVRADWLAQNQETARKFVRASIAGLRLLIAEPVAAMAALKRREPLFDEALENRRWQMTLERSIMTPNVRAGGFGVLDVAREQALITANAEAYGIANPPTPAMLFTGDYLPSAADRAV